MDAKVKWQGKMAFTGQANTGHAVYMDTDAGVGGEDKGVRPMELLLIGLGGCTAMDVISILNKKRQAVTDFEVRIHAGRAEEHPKVFTDAVIEYIFTGNDLEEAAVLRAIELSTTRYCPANAMFSRLMPVEFKYQIYEAAEEGQRALVRTGVFVPVLPEKVDGKAAG
jgi:putative redox protein